ncbi:MAG: response regulator transcription factor [Pyrinomonadaceae bacterium]
MKFADDCESGVRVPVLMLTARDAVEDRINGLDTGADDYLTKPFAFGELLARLRPFVRGGKLRDEKITIADLMINTKAQRAWRGGQAINLTTKEYALFEYLARENASAGAKRSPSTSGTNPSMRSQTSLMFTSTVCAARSIAARTCRSSTPGAAQATCCKTAVRLKRQPIRGNND